MVQIQPPQPISGPETHVSGPFLLGCFAIPLLFPAPLHPRATCCFWVRSYPHIHPHKPPTHRFVSLSFLFASTNPRNCPCRCAENQRPTAAATPARLGNSFPTAHRTATCAWSWSGARAEPLPTRQVSARFRPHRWPDSSSFATAPLHFTSTSQAAFPFHSFRRLQTAETGTDSGAPGDSGFQRPRGFAYRPGKQYGRETTSGQGISNTARGFACRRSQ